MDGGTCTSCSIGLTNVADTPLLAADAAATLTGSTLDDATLEQAVEAAKAITSPAVDGRGPAEFRTHVAGVMVERAVKAAAERAS